MASEKEIRMVDYLWGTLFYVVKQLADFDDSQSRLVSLILEIRQMTASSGEDRVLFEEESPFSNFWPDLAVWRLV